MSLTNTTTTTTTQSDEREVSGSVEVEVEDVPEEEAEPEEDVHQEPEEFSEDKCNLFSSAKYCELLKIIAESENEEQFLFKNYNRIDLTALPPKQYLEETVVPILMPALQYLISERPPEPINALCVYLLKYKADFEKYCNTEPPQQDQDDETEAKN
ncbi:hypothetical protein PPYR_03462 [Photinus pyralis]|uniref:Uncharacterized protein n=1 Tax=Photinus pyralis TaxID=7054 RepID=A0A5N4A2Y4_PHOPY|nr:protein dpy-30 homolog [Photinus pyralis]KAB0791662.1 hypothetical protein PPYR_03462 [Photinus pyralis]